MTRSNFLRLSGLAALAGFVPRFAMGFSHLPKLDFAKADFGSSFKWGVATAAYQVEGAHDLDGKSPSIWDTFAHTPQKILTGENADVACDFYHNYKADIGLVKEMNFSVNRFSIAWSRVKPDGVGRLNPLGIDFYHRVIDQTIALGLEPWITLYHWDLPQCLQDRGGWENRDVIDWFSEYVFDMVRAYGDKVKNWMILNEPMAFVGVGHLLGLHAPGHKNPFGFLKATHHASMCQAEGARIVRKHVKDANIGSTFSCAHISPLDNKPKSIRAAERTDAMLNRLFIEPAVGKGYPWETVGFLKQIQRYMKEGDAEKLACDFDFYGLQNYTRNVVKHSFIPPGSKMIEPDATKVEVTDMKWEVYPEGIYYLLKKFAAYPNVKKIIVTENGSAFPDTVSDGSVHDTKRTEYAQKYLAEVLRAKSEGVPVDGYFVWSLMDNFEWVEGFRPRFGLVHVNFQTQKRTIKDSGLWFKDFLK